VAVNWNTVKQRISVDIISRVLSEGGVISGLDCTCLHNLKMFYIQGSVNALFSQWQLMRNEGRLDGSLDVFNFLSRYFLNFCPRFEKSL
jgi:hypothetical protein